MENLASVLDAKCDLTENDKASADEKVDVKDESNLNFDAIIGHIEDIVIGEEFQRLQVRFTGCFL